MHRSDALGIWRLEVLECGVEGRGFLWFTCLREGFLKWGRVIITVGSRIFICGSGPYCTRVVQT